MNKEKAAVPEPIPQKYLERIIEIANDVWAGKKDMMLISRDIGRGKKLFIKGYSK